MARLNDPAPSLDAVESLKRRFIRQNREIARVNSTQSIRIRNLETEISRLLAENLAIREQAINIAQKAHKARKTCSRCSQLTAVKSQLEAKLSEISAVVNGLDVLDKDKQFSSPSWRRSSGLQLLNLPGQDRATFGSAERPVRQALEGWMPPILEDKRYPRKTLDAEELKAPKQFGEVNSESPDLGPPPVAHFDLGEESRSEPQLAGSGGREDETMALPPNLERRKKRRASVLLGDASSGADEPVFKQPDVTIRSTVGAKRKLSVRDDSDANSTTKTDLEDFSFSRNKNTPTTKHPVDEQKAVSQKSVNDQRRLETSPRKALQPKTTNSPTKSRRPTIEDKLAALKEDVARQGEVRRLLREKRTLTAPPTNAKTRKNDKLELQGDSPSEPNELPPTTPLNFDILTPSSTEPSTSRIGVPAPEVQAMASVEDVVSNASRPSRRPRGAVSYAEPNLRDKMRRPTKELAPAVTESDRPQQRASSAKPEDDSNFTATGENSVIEKPKLRTVVIKRENHSADGEWKNLPAADEETASPSVGRMTKHREVVAAAEGSNGESTGQPESSSNPSKDNSLNGPLSKLSIFDGPASSPLSPAPKTDAAVKDKLATKSSSRRHSSNPTGMRRVAGDFSSLQHQSVPRKRETRPDVPARPSSAMDRREAAVKSAKMARSESLRNLESRDRERGKDIPTSTALSDGGRRGERMVARRRSMMI